MASNIFLMTLTRAKCRRYYVLFQSLNPSLWHPFSALLVTVWLAFSPTCIFYQGCALREPSGPWLLTFALRHQEYLQLPGGCHACNVWLFQEKLQTVLVWGSVCCVFQSTFDVLLSFSLVLLMESCSKIFFPCQSCLWLLTLYVLKSADQQKISLSNINVLKNGVVMRIAYMIWGDESWFFNKFSPLLLLKNYRDSKWESQFWN